MKQTKLYIVKMLAVTVCLVCLSILPYCATPTGGGSEAGNARITGKVIDSQGAPAANAKVTVRNAFFDPVKDMDDAITCQTGSDGTYAIMVEKGYSYTVEALIATRNTRALITEIAVQDSQTLAPQCTLKTTGTLKVKVPDNADRKRGYVYIPGTSLFALLTDLSDFAILTNVPSVLMRSVVYSTGKSQDVSTIRQNVIVRPADTSVIYNTQWKYTCQIVLNTTSTGAGVTGNVTNFPVCVRLTSSNFAFDQARSDGADIRFAKKDTAFLPYEIESWDAVNRQAVLWVNVDTVYGNDSTHYLTMYWGNPGAVNAENSAAVFDTAVGFQGVWHLSGKGSEKVSDATANEYAGTPYGVVSNATVKGVIGAARQFDGSTNYITMPNTAAGKLNMPQNGTYTFSLWAFADTIDTLWHSIAGKGHEQYYLKFKCFKNGKGTWEFVDFKDQKGWEFTEDSIPPAPGVGQWVYLTGVRSGTTQYLYVNGVLANDASHLMAGNYARNTGDDFMIGRCAREVTIPYSEGWCYFKGMVDEVRVMNVALTADWIKLSYMNQKAEDALMKFR